MYFKKTQKNSKRLEKHKLLYNGGGGILGGLSNFVIHTETNLSTPMDKLKSTAKSLFKQPKAGLMQIIYNRGLPNARILDTNINNSNSKKPLFDSETDTKPYIQINSDNKCLVVLVELLPNMKRRLLWAVIIRSRTIKQNILEYIAPTPLTSSNYEFRIYAYPKGQNVLTSQIQTILYQQQQQQKQQSQAQKQPGTQQIAKPMNNLKFQSSGLDITRTKEYGTYMEYVNKNRLKLIKIKPMKVIKNTSSGTAILSKIMA